MAVTANAQMVIREIIEARARAMSAGDVDGIVADLAEDIAIFDVVGPLRGDGRASARRRAQEWLGSYQEGPTWENRDIRVASDETVAFSHSLSHVTGRLKIGALVDMWFRTTLGFERRDGRWLIVHDHGSKPFDPKTGKASLDLKP
jgi:ketosteroid isomerase-like protein